ncbi:hypothetical protein AAHN93_09795 [Vandammella animalimorsus]|uniref:hypothetical protein n=1 Tax=Vandammella animalimorsus TaxID=2029117 RepID=UPI0031BA66F2
MKQGFFRHSPMLLAVLLLAACAGHAQSQTAGRDQAVSESAAPFNGQWKFRFCPEGVPSEDDCGGFSVDLRQKGDRVCGLYFGSRVGYFGGSVTGLGQIDEGTINSGVVIGRTAVLVATSGRDSSMYLIRARLGADDSLEWRELEQIWEAPSGSGDGFTDTYHKPLPKTANQPSAEASACFNHREEVIP